MPQIYSFPQRNSSDGAYKESELLNRGITEQTVNALNRLVTRNAMVREMMSAARENPNMYQSGISIGSHGAINDIGTRASLYKDESRHAGKNETVETSTFVDPMAKLEELKKGTEDQRALADLIAKAQAGDTTAQEELKKSASSWAWALGLTD